MLGGFFFFFKSDILLICKWGVGFDSDIVSSRFGLRYKEYWVC